MTLETTRTQDGRRAPPTAPRHVAVIMDGNGRWAERQGMPRNAGHRAGTENIRRILHAFSRGGVKYVTLFAFSTENWGRPKGEIEGLLEILQDVIRDEIEELHRENVRIRHLGVLDRLPEDLVYSIHNALELTENNDGPQLIVAFDYGGRTEIVHAVRAIVEKGVAAQDVTEAMIADHLYLPDVPDPDLVIRTGGEERLSNFLMWQTAYSEFYGTPVLWPDFDDQEVDRALAEYRRRRERSAGGGIETSGTDTTQQLPTTVPA